MERLTGDLPQSVQPLLHPIGLVREEPAGFRNQLPRPS
jgi:hypothetical protein